MNPALRSSAAHVFVQSVAAPELSSDDAHHLFRVMRLRDGEVVTVSDGAGQWRITHVVGQSLVPAGEVQAETAPRSFTVASAIPKGDRLEWMVQKLTELDVSEIVLLHCARSAVRWDAAKAARQLPRLARVAREASMQSRRVWLPTVSGPVAFDAVASGADVVIADPSGEPFTKGERSLTERGRLTVVIGPEGGLSEEELASGPPLVSLGARILRVETAALVAAVCVS
ncbi:MAG: RsmE family RNA methyltransferase [Actinomycetota bacterium]|nr:RsmE family RNA methyltransferase [Actinomycetota bacterium]